LATPNYGYEKRQKELAKKRKKEDKLKSKTERRTDGSEPASDGDTAPDAVVAPAYPQITPPNL
jgi:hypothetical protein